MGELVLAGWADLSPVPSSRDLAVQKWLRWRHVNLLIWRPSCYARPHLLTHTRSHDPYNYLIQFIFLYILHMSHTYDGSGVNGRKKYLFFPLFFWKTTEKD